MLQFILSELKEQNTTMITVTMVMTIMMKRAREMVDGFRETKKDKMVKKKKYEDENQ
jgi:hypothetical protein